MQELNDSFTDAEAQPTVAVAATVVAAADTQLRQGPFDAKVSATPAQTSQRVWHS